MSSSKSNVVVSGSTKNDRNYNYICGMRYKHLPPISGGRRSLYNLPYTLISEIDTLAIENERTSNVYNSNRLPSLTDMHMGMSIDDETIPRIWTNDWSQLNPKGVSVGIGIGGIGGSSQREMHHKDKELMAPAKPSEGSGTNSNKSEILIRYPEEPKKWLRRQQLLAGDENLYRGAAPSRMESRLATDKVDNDILHQTHEEQIEAIEESFSVVNDPNWTKNLKHPQNPDLKPVEILPVFPEFEIVNGSLLAEINFDGEIRDPNDSSDEEKDDFDYRVTKSLLIPMSTDQEKFLMMYVPNSDSAKRKDTKRKFDELDDYEMFQYRWLRDYAFSNTPLGVNDEPNEQIWLERKIKNGEKEEVQINTAPVRFRSELKRRCLEKNELGRRPEFYGRTKKHF
ncbi:14334_t:CDS:2 [Entrophospora sp. SA101]|nr:14334_t:CDS:2 [Entrophospora sp. SA101]CAJ0921574.1 21623_t:CDS:2 [Entrophospora sp. SA101]